MKKTTAILLILIASALLPEQIVNACTNFLITKGASKDGSVMITYSADSHVLYGELYFWPARNWPAGSMTDVYEWDTGKYLGKIPQVSRTYSVIGNMNQYQLSIGETTFGGREELANPDGIIDYGSLIYLTLQRAKSAREAIVVFSTLLDEWGYASSGESFSIADKNEAWILELTGKGPGKKGAAWVARRIPDGYISGHANHPRITTFPLADGVKSITNKDLDKIYNPDVETVYAWDVIDVARSYGWFTGKDETFSFSDAYAPLDFSAARFCEARVWAGFNTVNSQMGQYLDYAMGENLNNRMPLWIKPDRKLEPRDVMSMMRNYYQDSPMDMTKDVGAGPYGSTVRWRPMQWEVDGVKYIHERAISTQQTGFSFVAQSRSWLPDPVGGIFWFGVDDTYYTVYTPVYCGSASVPEAYAVGNGDMMTFSDDAAFWVFNQVTNFAYTRTSLLIGDLQKKQSELENRYFAETSEVDRIAAALYEKKPSKAVKYITEYSVNTGNKTVAEWKELYKFLFTKYVDGNVKEARPVPEGYKYYTPAVSQPGYGEEWLRVIVNNTGDKLKER
ncbi:MAG: C69 family dipeptidase [Bacteroidales bacterium]|jgi:dipeptidase|nr:C69 family dipeptidase [Bacteroidales bacterium]